MNLPDKLSLMFPGKAWRLPAMENPGYSDLEWLDDSQKPTEDEFDAALLTVIKRERAAYINKRRDSVIAGGAEFGGATYDTDAQSVANLTAAVAFIQAAPSFGIEAPETVSWRDADNVDHDLTPAQLVQLGAVIFEQVQTAHMTARALKDAINAAETIDAVNAIDWP